MRRPPRDSGPRGAPRPGASRSTAARAVAAAPRMYETINTEPSSTQWIERARGRDAVRVRHRDHQPRIHAGGDRRRVVRRAPGVAAYLPLQHDYAGAPDQLDREASLAKLKPLLESEQARQGRPSPQVRRARARNHGIELRGMRFDSMLESYVWNSVHRHDMDSAAERYSASARSTTRTSRAKARSRFRSARCPVDKAPNIPPRIPT
jgi:DNA polymerase-1